MQETGQQLAALGGNLASEVRPSTHGHVYPIIWLEGLGLYEGHCITIDRAGDARVANEINNTKLIMMDILC